MNTFQRFLLKPENRSIIHTIIKLFHPDLLDEYPNPYKEGKTIKLDDRLKIGIKYDWITIEANIPSYGRISIGVEFNSTVMSGTKPLKRFEQSLIEDKFKAWRFYDDVKNKSYSEEGHETNNPDVHDLLISLKVPKPTAQEMSDYYHQD